MKLIDFTFEIDSHERQQDFPQREQVHLQAQFHHEPADPTVGIMSATTELESVFCTETDCEMDPHEMEAWGEIKREAREALDNHIEEAKLESQLAAYQNRKAYNGWYYMPNQISGP